MRGSRRINLLQIMSKVKEPYQITTCQKTCYWMSRQMMHPSPRSKLLPENQEQVSENRPINVTIYS